MASGTIQRSVLLDDIFVTPAISVNAGTSITITFSTTRDNGLISITGSTTARIALYAYSGINGATPVLNKLCGADLDSYFTAGTGTITFTPNYGAVVKIMSFNNTGRITISQSS